MQAKNTSNHRDAVIYDAGVTSVADVQKQNTQMAENKAKLLQYVGDNIIGSHRSSQLKTVFGLKPNMYLDHTASGKPLKFIEDYLRDTVMPMYANTHTE
jgi:hypothetical protein